MRGDNCVIFTTRTQMELRVVFDPDGKAFFCGVDLAVIAGYGMPRKAVTGGNQGTNRIDTVLRKVPWDNGMKQGRCEFTCFSAENAIKFLCRRPAPYEYIRWLEDDVIPKTEVLGKVFARNYVDWLKDAEKMMDSAIPTETPEKDRAYEIAEAVARIDRSSGDIINRWRAVGGQTQDDVGSIIKRLDTIILECALLKKDLCQITR